MPNWDLYQKILHAKPEDLEKIKKRIVSRFSDHTKSSDLESVLAKWQQQGKWMDPSEEDLTIDQILEEEEVIQ